MAVHGQEESSGFNQKTLTATNLAAASCCTSSTGRAHPAHIIRATLVWAVLIIAEQWKWLHLQESSKQIHECAFIARLQLQICKGTNTFICLSGWLLPTHSYWACEALAGARRISGFDWGDLLCTSEGLNAIDFTPQENNGQRIPGLQGFALVSLPTQVTL